MKDDGLAASLSVQWTIVPILSEGGQMSVEGHSVGDLTRLPAEQRASP
ncbi:MAG TPA: hypothetical protein VF884_08185 [Nitrososphaeraceae archaeon]